MNTRLFFFAIIAAIFALTSASGSHNDDKGFAKRNIFPNHQNRRHHMNHADPNVSPKQQRRMRSCTKRLSHAGKELKCALLRVSLPKRISEAEQCRFNGLPIAEYRQLRNVCKQRYETLLRVKRAKMMCEKNNPRARKVKDVVPQGFDVAVSCENLDQLMKLRHRAVRACERIGWGGKRNCELIHPLKKKLQHILKGSCGEDGVVESKLYMEKLKRKCKRLGGMKPKPSNAPRM